MAAEISKETRQAGSNRENCGMKDFEITDPGKRGESESEIKVRRVSANQAKREPENQGKAKLVRDEDERIYVAKPIAEWTDHRVASILSYLRAPEFPRCLGWCGSAADLPAEEGFCSNMPEIYVSPKQRVGSYLMEYIEGKSLADLRNEDLSADVVMEWILHLQDSLQKFSELLQKTILHLDIKPGNIIISSNNTPVLIDFDCALILDDFAGQWVEVKRATVAYAAPEVQAGRPHLNSDLFSLARTAISVLAGKPYLALDETEIADALSRLDEKNKGLLLRWQNSNPELRSERRVPSETSKSELSEQETDNLMVSLQGDDGVGGQRKACAGGSDLLLPDEPILQVHPDKSSLQPQPDGTPLQMGCGSALPPIKPGNTLTQMRPDKMLSQTHPDKSSLQLQPDVAPLQMDSDSTLLQIESGNSLSQTLPDKFSPQLQSDKILLQKQPDNSLLQLPTIPLLGFDQSKPLTIHLEYKLTVAPLAGEGQPDS